MPGGGSQKSTTSNEPWKGQAPYLRDIYSQAQGLNQGGTPHVYTGPRVAGFTPDQLSAFQGARTVGASGLQLANDELSGKYLNAGNPHFGAMADRISRSVIPNVQSAFETSGRFGGGYNSGAVASALSDKIGDLAYSDYGAERGYQQQAPGLAQQLIAMLSGAGGAQQGQAQTELQAKIDQFNEMQNAPWQRLGMYSSAVGGPVPGTQTTKTPGPSLAQQLIGGLLGGASLAGGLGWSPLG